MEVATSSATKKAAHDRLRVVRVPVAGGSSSDWRSLLWDEVHHHGFALICFAGEHGGDDGNGTTDHDNGRHGEARGEDDVSRLLDDHRQLTRPQFFGESDGFKRRLMPREQEGASAQERTANERIRMGPLGDTGYCLRPNVKEQLQVRLGPRMPWPRGDLNDEDARKYARMQNETEALFGVLDVVARRCVSALLGAARWKLHAMLDPSPEALRTLISECEDGEAEAQPTEGSVEDYTSSSVLLLSHYFNTEAVSRAKTPLRKECIRVLLLRLIMVTPLCRVRHCHAIFMLTRAL